MNLALYEGNSLIGWAVEYVNSQNVLRTYVDSLIQNPTISAQESDRINLRIECQRIMGETAKSCIRTMLDGNMFNLGELTEAFVLLEPYISGTSPDKNRKKA